jgi:hypothetical protein
MSALPLLAESPAEQAECFSRQHRYSLQGNDPLPRATAAPAYVHPRTCGTRSGVR